MIKKFFVFCVMLFMFNSMNINAECAGLYPEDKEHFTIVIDPGHGGDNWGTTSNENFKEKEITMKTALAIVEELEKYNDVTVYLTHEKDVDISLKNRAVFAKEKNADFLFSIHYNASENHSMFGTEVWIPIAAPYHSYGYKYAYLQQLEMQELGLFSRGVRSRINEKGTDYYGIIRECVAREIPAVIIEHCYIDEERDAAYCDEDSDYAEFGRRDAIAIAKYLGLVEASADVSSLEQIGIQDTVAYTYEDTSIPEICKIAIGGINTSKSELTIKVNGKDSDTPLMYYSYSLDGGKNFSKLYPWSGSNILENYYDESFTLSIPVTDWDNARIVLRAYNKFDLYKESNLLTNVEIKHAKEAAENTSSQIEQGNEKDEIVIEQKQTDIPVISEKQESPFTVKRFLLLFVFVILWILLLFVIGRAVYSFICKK